MAVLIEKYYEDDILEAVKKAKNDLRGSFALGILCQDESDRLIVLDVYKRQHPSKNIEGYEIITTKSDEKGNIIYVYRKKPDPTKVVTKFVDEKGNPIAKSEDGKKPKKDIKGYEFVKTETDKDGNTCLLYTSRCV